MHPTVAGPVPLDALPVHHQVYGPDLAGTPLLLLHGGMQTVEGCFDPLLPLLADRPLIGVELQGHGRTPDVERPPTLDVLAGDVVGVLDHLGLERVDVFGFSLGALVGLELAVRHPARVGRLVFTSAHTRADGFHTEIRDPELWATSTRMPPAETFATMRAEHARVAPAGSDIDATMERYQAVVGAETNWSPDEMGAVAARTLVMVGDHDFVTLEHAVATHAAIPDAQLAVIPDATHGLLHEAVDVVGPVVRRFLGR